MAIKFQIDSRNLKFLFKAGTSRGVLSNKKAWYIRVSDPLNPTIYGIGETGPLKGLSIDDVPDFEVRLLAELDKLNGLELPISSKDVYEIANQVSPEMPSVRFGVETALLDLVHGGKYQLFENMFYQEMKPIRINGLVWMGDNELMIERLYEKIDQGFSCIKIKIGAIDFENEMKLIELARKKFPSSKLELRVDANGAFNYKKAIEVLKRLKELEVHSIEQPIKAGQIQLMRQLCESTPVPIALDEELIGIYSYQQKKDLIHTIKPQYIILKPSLIGGFQSAKEWIDLAENNKIGWWITSALESNIGLNAICQFASSLNVNIPQGLGTGGLYQNNIESPLEVIKDEIVYNRNKKWETVM